MMQMLTEELLLLEFVENVKSRRLTISVIMHPIFTTCREKSLEISTCHLTTHTACGLDASY